MDNIINKNNNLKGYVRISDHEKQVLKASSSPPENQLVLAFLYSKNDSSNSWGKALIRQCLKKKFSDLLAEGKQTDWQEHSEHGKY